MKWKLTVKVDQEMIQEEVDSLSILQRELHGKIQCIKAETQLDLDKNDVLFFNGYQTWTYNKEMQIRDKQKGVNHKICRRITCSKISSKNETRTHAGWLQVLIL